MKTRAEPPFSVHLYISDPCRAELVRRRFREHPLIDLQCLKEPDVGDNAHAWVLPARVLADSLPAFREKKPETVWIGYGEAGFLRQAFLLGCADFLKEPWEAEELECRLLRLLESSAPRALPWGGLFLEPLGMRGPAGEVRLSFPEQRILQLLLRNLDHPVSRQALSYTLWGRLPRPASRALDVHISSLRGKIRGLFPAGADGIATVRGRGYILRSRL